VVLDDALQGVTHVIRGQDLFEAAHIQRLLQALLDLPTPTYRHHRLLVGPDGKRYAKRDKAQTLRELRAGGRDASRPARRDGLRLGLDPVAIGVGGSEAFKFVQRDSRRVVGLDLQIGLRCAQSADLGQ
jgi:hypothetical protein